MSHPGESGSEPNVVVIKQGGGWFGRILLFIGLIGVLFAAWLGLAAINLLPSFIKSPFTTEVTEGKEPILLTEITDASDFLAAKGSFQTVVDYKETAKVLGIDIGFFYGCSAVYVVYGNVDATVDVAGLTDDAIVVSPDGRDVTVYLPDPTLSEVQVNLGESVQLSSDQGIVQRVIGFLGFPQCPSEQQLLQAGADKIQKAAEDSGLRDRAEQNTKAWLEGTLHSLGYERVTINFGPNPA